MNDDQYEERIKYWLRTIDTIVCTLPKSTIVIVGTHLDLVNQDRLNLVENRIKQIASKNKSVKSYLFVSSVTKKNIDVLEETIIDLSVKFKYSNKIVPSFYLKFDKLLEEKKKKGVIFLFFYFFIFFLINFFFLLKINSLTFYKFTQLSRNCGVPKDSLLSLGKSADNKITIFKKNNKLIKIINKFLASFLHDQGIIIIISILL